MTSEKSNSPVWKAMLLNKKEEVIQQLTLGNSDPNELCSVGEFKGCTMLQYLLIFQDLKSDQDFEFIEDLISLGADPNKCNENAGDSLWIATCKGNIEVAKILIQKGAKIEIPGEIPFGMRVL